MIADYEQNVVRNGVDFLKIAINSFNEDQENESNLKYTVLHLYSAVEILLKARLVRESWTLVFENIDDAVRKDFLSGNFRSISLEETIDRLENILEIEGLKERTFHAEELAIKDWLEKLHREFYRLQYIGASNEKWPVNILMAAFLTILVNFIKEQFQDLGSSPRARKDLEDLVPLIEKTIQNTLKRREERYKEIKNNIKRNADRCPRCVEETVIQSPEGVKCLFCGTEWSNKTTFDHET